MALTWLSLRHVVTTGSDGNLAKLNSGLSSQDFSNAQLTLKVREIRFPEPGKQWHWNYEISRSHHVGQEWTEAGNSVLTACAKENPFQLEINCPHHGCASTPKSPNLSQTPPETLLPRPHSFLGCKGAGWVQFSFSTPTSQSWKEGRPECARGWLWVPILGKPQMNSWVCLKSNNKTVRSSKQCIHARFGAHTWVKIS